MSVINNLPVAPEFVDILAENATSTALAYLRKIKAQKELIDLVENIAGLGYYLTKCYSDPTSLTSDRADRFDIEAVVIETVNAIAKLGGSFRDPSGDSLPLDIAQSVERKK